jgi:RimJ/RimL family protein N-acetyltransferase
MTPFISKDMTPLTTDHLIIRRFTEADIQPSYEMNLDAEVSRYTGDGGVVSKDEIERRIREHVFGDYEKYGFGRWAVEWKSSGEFIGFCGLKYLKDRDEIDLGYRFKSEFWGKGIATEAGRVTVDWGFKHLNPPYLMAMVLPENSGSIRVLQKLGFKKVGREMEDGEWAEVWHLHRGKD